MKLLLSFALMLACAVPVHAEEAAGASASAQAGAAAIEKLGGLNGQALACRQMAISVKAKQALVANAPKTQQTGEAFEARANGRRSAAPTSCAPRAPRPRSFRCATTTSTIWWRWA